MSQQFLYPSENSWTNTKDDKEHRAHSAHWKGVSQWYLHAYNALHVCASCKNATSQQTCSCGVVGDYSWQDTNSKLEDIRDNLRSVFLPVQCTVRFTTDMYIHADQNRCQRLKLSRATLCFMYHYSSFGSTYHWRWLCKQDSSYKLSYTAGTIAMYTMQSDCLLQLMKPS